MSYFEEKKNIRYFQNMFYPTEKKNENNFYHCKKWNANLPVNFITSDMI